MGKVYEHIDEALEAFIQAQSMFFVATAPLNASGHVNLSPKGLDTLRVIGPRTVAYLDYVGSGAETIAHLRENGRIVLMLCAFQGAPRIVRFHGRGDVLEPNDDEFRQLRASFPADPAGRAIVRIAIDRISDSCGFGVPLYEFEKHRPQLSAWAARKGERGLLEYQHAKNRVSIDGLPALRAAALEIRDAQLPRDEAVIERLWLSYLTWGNDEMQARHGVHPHSPREAVSADMVAIAKFQPPDGCIVLAFQQGQACGIGCLRRIGSDVCEIKRMFVDPAFRRVGAGRAILEHLMAAAARSGYSRIRLDSLGFMTAAHALYRRFGFVDIEAYPESEIAESFRRYMVFMERDVERIG